jgi:formate/nitrite transporter
MDVVTPAEMVVAAVASAEKRAVLPVPHLLIRGALAGGFLGLAASLALTCNAQGLPPIVGALIFPVGLVMLVLLGFELVTGNFALLPMAWMQGRLSLGAVLRNWTWVYIGNLIGALFYAVLFWIAITNFGSASGGPVGDVIKAAAVRKTTAYAAIGAAGWVTVLVKAVLCNWMATTGAILGFSSRSTAGRIIAIWLPITTFFAQGYEHAVVNMFVIPTGMLLNAPVSVSQWWIWNEIPVTLGNLLAGATLTGTALCWTYSAQQPQVQPESVVFEPEKAGARQSL